MDQTEELKKVNRVYKIRNILFLSCIVFLIITAAGAYLRIEALFFIMLACTAYAYFGVLYLTERASNMVVT